MCCGVSAEWNSCQWVQKAPSRSSTTAEGSRKWITWYDPGTSVTVCPVTGVALSGYALGQEKGVN